MQALRGEDVFYTEFSDKAFKSRAASPVIYHSQTIGAVYAYEYDTEQAELLLSLQRNLLTISAVVLVFAGGIDLNNGDILDFYMKCQRDQGTEPGEMAAEFLLFLTDAEDRSISPSPNTTLPSVTTRQRL